MKFRDVEDAATPAVSHPARGAWIEIVFAGVYFGARIVAPRKGCVD